MAVSNLDDEIPLQLELPFQRPSWNALDAALDEANIGRFIGVLREFLSFTQFVVITHSKKTMSGADTLYGVTMEEPGVSKLISVQLN